MSLCKQKIVHQEVQKLIALGLLSNRGPIGPPGLPGAPAAGSTIGNVPTGFTINKGDTITPAQLGITPFQTYGVPFLLSTQNTLDFQPLPNGNYQYTGSDSVILVAGTTFTYVGPNILVTTPPSIPPAGFFTPACPAAVPTPTPCRTTCVESCPCDVKLRQQIDLALLTLQREGRLTDLSLAGPQGPNGIPGYSNPIGQFVATPALLATFTTTSPLICFPIAQTQICPCLIQGLTIPVLIQGSPFDMALVGGNVCFTYNQTGSVTLTLNNSLIIIESQR